MSFIKKFASKNLIFFCFIILMILCQVTVCPSAKANGDPLEGDLRKLKIKEIQYRSDANFSEEMARSATVIKIGDNYSDSAIRKSIEGIFSIGGFSNIEADIQAKAGGLSLTFIIYKQAAVGSIRMDGNRRVSRDEIIEVMRLRTGYKYTESFAESDAKSIKELYKLHGYMNAKISYSVNIDSKTNEANVTFNVDEGEHPIITQIIFTGTNEAVVPTRNLLKAMRDIRLGWTYRGQRTLDIDVKRIEEMYREKEYLTAKIANAKALSEPDEIEKYNGIGRHFIAEGLSENDLRNGSVTILIEIEQGKRVYIKINGNDHINDKDIKKVVALNRMRSVSESVIRRSRDDIMKLYKTNGFYLVDVKYEILKDKIWDFDKDTDTEGWQILPPAEQFQVSNGRLEIEKGYAIELSGITIDSNIYQKAQVRMRIRSDMERDRGNSAGQLFWTTVKSQKWDQKKSRTFSEKLYYDNQFHDYEIQLYRSKRWSDKINRLRLVPVDVAVSPDTDIEWIKLTTEFIPIVFTITENPQIRIRQPIKIKRQITEPIRTSIGGKEQTLNEELIRKQMLTRPKGFFSFWFLKKYFSTGILNEDVFAEDLRAIEALYKDFGFTKPTVESEKKIMPEKGEIEITVKINEGPRTLVDEIIVEGNKNDVIAPQDLISSLNVVDDPKIKQKNITNQDGMFRYRPEDPKPYREYEIVADRSVLSLMYADKGYLAEIEPDRRLSDDMTKATIIYKIAPGNLIRLADKIEIRGNDRTKNSVIEREISKTLIRDKIFSFSEIESSAQGIRNIGIFESVNPETQQAGNSEDLYNLIFNIKERPAKSVNLHVGYNSLEDIQGGIEASDINLWGRAHRLSGKAQLGLQSKRVEGEYAVPKIFPGLRRSDVFGVINLYPYSQYSDVDYSEIRKGGKIGVSWNFRTNNTLKLDYRYDVLEYNLYGQNEVTKIGRIEILSQRDARDNLLNPRGGSFYALTLEYANPKLGGLEEFTKLSLNSMYFMRLIGNSVLALSLRTGHAWGLGGTDRPLAPELFKMRDYQTPRGYDWKRENKDAVLLNMGAVLLNTSMEIRLPIYKSFGIALFFDSGHTYNSISDFDIDAMQSSVGLGLRIITPIGPIRLDYGYPIRGDGKRDYWPVFAFGNPF